MIPTFLALLLVIFWIILILILILIWLPYNFKWSMRKSLLRFSSDFNENQEFYYFSYASKKSPFVLISCSVPLALLFFHQPSYLLSSDQFWISLPNLPKFLFFYSSIIDSILIFRFAFLVVFLKLFLYFMFWIFLFSLILLLHHLL